MTKMKALTFKEKQDVLRQVFSLYRRSKLRLKCLEESSYYPQVRYGVVREKHVRYNKSVIDKLNEQIDSIDELKEIILTFECIVDTLSSESRTMIFNEFIDQNDKNWWLEYYSRSSYYRAKTRAMEEFLFYLNV